MGLVVGEGAPTAVLPQEGARVTRSTWPVSPEGLATVTPLGASLHSGYTLYPDPGFPAQSLEPLLGPSSGWSGGTPGVPSGAVPRAGLGGPRPGQAWVWLRPHWSRGRGGTGRRESARVCTLYSGLRLFKYLYPRCADLDLRSTWFENFSGQEARTRDWERELAARPLRMRNPQRPAPDDVTPGGRARRSPSSRQGSALGDLALWTAHAHARPRLCVCVSAVFRVLRRPPRSE